MNSGPWSRTWIVVIVAVLISLPLFRMDIKSFGTGLYQETNVGKYNGTVRLSEGSNYPVCLGTSDGPGWTEQIVYGLPPFDDRGDIAPILGTTLYLYRRGESEPPGERFYYYLFDRSKPRSTLIRNEYSPARFLDVDFAPIYGTDRVFIMLTKTGGKGLDFQIYDHSGSTFFSPPSPMPDECYMRYDSAISSISDCGKVLLFGGRGGIYPNTKYMNDTWVYDDRSGSWERLDTAASPPAVFYQGIAPINGTDKVLMFGGLNGTLSNETWLFDLSDRNWTRLDCPLSPPPCDYIDMSPVPGSPIVAMFGGWDGYRNLSETWVFNGDKMRWDKADTEDPPSPRSKYFMAEVVQTQEVLLWGGSGDFDRFHLFHPSEHPYNGTFTSKPYFLGANITLRGISLNGSYPEGTDMGFKVRLGNSESVLTGAMFLGPNGSSTDWYPSIDGPIGPPCGDPLWVQVLVRLETVNKFRSPLLYVIGYEIDHLPEAKIVSPGDGWVGNGSRITVVWEYLDEDDDPLTSVEVRFARERDLTDPAYTFLRDHVTESRVVIEDPGLPDGRWFFGIRVMDGTGIWSRTRTGEIWIESVPPEYLIMEPAHGRSYSRLDLIGGTCYDPGEGSGVISVHIMMKRVSDGFFLDGTGWVPGPVWLKADGLEYWRYRTNGIDFFDGEYSLSTMVTDLAGNVLMDPDVVSFAIDGTGPAIIVFRIEGGRNQTENRTIRIDSSCMDVSGTEFVSFSIDGSEWGNWIAYDESMVIQLPGDYGPKTIHMRAMDTLGNIGVPVNATITVTTSTEVPHEEEDTTTSIENDLALITLLSFIAIWSMIGLILIAQRSGRIRIRG